MNVVIENLSLPNVVKGFEKAIASKEDVSIVLYPGYTFYSLVDTIAAYDYLRISLPTMTTNVEIRVLSSYGFTLLPILGLFANNNRYIAPRSWCQFHELSRPTSGGAISSLNTIKFANEVADNFLDILVDRLDITKDEVKEWCKDNRLVSLDELLGRGLGD